MEVGSLMMKLFHKALKAVLQKDCFVPCNDELN